MKLLGAVAMLMAGMGAWPGESAQKPKRVVMACLNPGANGSMMYRGEATAAQILMQAGVRLDWRSDESACAEGAGVVVTVSLATPANEHPGALAFARPFNRTSIVVFYDRVVTAVGPTVTPKLLGHVLAHEVVHMLQGCTQHSTSGLMKPRWDKKDYDDMQRATLPFTQVDRALIDHGLEWRASRAVAAE
jgi:hypothetical protein